LTEKEQTLEHTNLVGEGLFLLGNWKKPDDGERMCGSFWQACGLSGFVKAGNRDRRREECSFAAP
jgi:hypothetical protein